MCYKDPENGIALVLEGIGDLKSTHGDSPLEDFDHFCAYSGLSEDEVGRLPFLWTKYGYYRHGSQPPTRPLMTRERHRQSLIGKRMTRSQSRR